MGTISRTGFFSLAVSSVLLLSSCGGSASPAARLESKSLPVTTTQSASFRIRMSEGTLKMTGGSAKLVDATFSYATAKPEMKSAVTREAAGDVSAVEVSQPKGGAGSDAWQMTLGGGQPTDIVITAGHALVDLDLSVVDVKRLVVDGTGGTASVKLKGPHPSLSLVEIDEVNDVTVDLSGEYPALEKLQIATSHGDVSLDLSGPWHKDATLTVDSFAGAVKLVAPRSANVRVLAERSEGGPFAGFDRQGSTWVHKPAQPNPSTVTVVVGQSAGGRLELGLGQ